MSAGRLLIIDDDRDLAESLAEYLQLDGYEVQVSFSGRSGCEAALAGSFDCVLIDVGLPDIDGYQVMRQIVEKRPSLKVALMSGHSAQDLDPVSSRLRSVQVIMKPLDLDDLTRRLADGSLGAHGEES